MSDSTNTGVTYEYKVFTAMPNSTKLDGNWRPVSDDSEAGLNALIRDGWELVSTHVGQNAWYSLGCGHSMSQMNFVLRRPAA